MRILNSIMANRQKLQEKAINIFGTGTTCMLEYLADESNDKKLAFDIKINNWESHHIWYDLIIVEVGEVKVVIHIYAENQTFRTLELFNNFVEYADKIIKKSLKKEQ